MACGSPAAGGRLVSREPWVLRGLGTAGEGARVPPEDTKVTKPRPTAFDRAALLACARGELFGPGNAQLPAPPMLMMDRITDISGDGGAHGKGHVVAEFDIRPDLWFFECHFPGNPIMPGCLGLDGLWQLTGFNLGWRGWTGRGYALGVGEVKLTGMVRPDRRMLTYRVDFTKAIQTRRLTMGVADGTVEADGEVIYIVRDMKVALSEG